MRPQETQDTHSPSPHPVSRVYDVDLAAYLVCAGHDLTASRCVNSRCFFEFARTDARDAALLAWSDPGATLLVDARKFAERRVAMYRWVRDEMRRSGSSRGPRK